MTDDATRQFVAMMPFAELLGIELEHARAESVAGRLRWREELCTAGGVMHGGALMALADTIGAICAFLNLPPGAGTATISSSANMLRDDSGRLVAQVTQAQAVFAAGSPSA